VFTSTSPPPPTTGTQKSSASSRSARRVNIGRTGAESWTVLTDPQGNEFCVVRPKSTLTG
jgi:hypothetical protein